MVFFWELIQLYGHFGSGNEAEAMEKYIFCLPVNKWEKERSVLGLRLEFLNYNGDYDIVCGCVCKWILLEDKSLTGAPFFYNEYNFIDSRYITKSVISFSALRLRFETSM